MPGFSQLLITLPSLSVANVSEFMNFPHKHPLFLESYRPGVSVNWPYCQCSRNFLSQDSVLTWPASGKAQNPFYFKDLSVSRVFDLPLSFYLIGSLCIYVHLRSGELIHLKVSWRYDISTLNTSASLIWWMRNIFIWQMRKCNLSNVK